jgi:hypothetical protein
VGVPLAVRHGLYVEAAIQKREGETGREAGLNGNALYAALTTNKGPLTNTLEVTSTSARCESFRSAPSYATARARWWRAATRAPYSRAEGRSFGCGARSDGGLCRLELLCTETVGVGFERARLLESSERLAGVGDRPRSVLVSATRIGARAMVSRRTRNVRVSSPAARARGATARRARSRRRSSRSATRRRRQTRPRVQARRDGELHARWARVREWNRSREGRRSGDRLVSARHRPSSPLRAPWLRFLPSSSS